VMSLALPRCALGRSKAGVKWQPRWNREMLDDSLQRLRDHFQGVWHVSREIDDSHSAAKGQFTGHARLWQSLDGLAYHEEGVLILGESAPLKAERRYFWQLQTPLRIDVFFEDGRYFHSFNPNEKQWQAEHICTPDNYVVTYDFVDSSHWRSIWDVRGPKKSYRMVSNYSR
jgi:hypothetical protein